MKYKVKNWNTLICREQKINIWYWNDEVVVDLLSYDNTISAYELENKTGSYTIDFKNTSSDSTLWLYIKKVK